MKSCNGSRALPKITVLKKLCNRKRVPHVSCDAYRTPFENRSPGLDHLLLLPCHGWTSFLFYKEYRPILKVSDKPLHTNFMCGLLSLHYPLHCRFDMRDTHAVVLQEFFGSARLAKFVV